jgi:hypothetical protein
MRFELGSVARVLVCAGLLGLAPAALAQDLEAACGEDLAVHCAKPDQNLFDKTQCLRAHVQDLSDSCRAVLDAPAQRRADAGDACGDDAVRLCPDTQQGRRGTGLLNCLRANAAALTDECRTAIDALPGKKRDGAASPVE